jgi:hypothetical protein
MEVKMLNLYLIISSALSFVLSGYYIFINKKAIVGENIELFKISLEKLI